jgi:hypothetical protein
MLARLQSRMTYANVVATLALFVALGGSAYAVATITSGDVKNRSLRGKDLKRNTLTGKEVKESSLGRVKTASNALASITAQTAALAQSADLAKNSDAVGGVGIAGLEKSSRIQFARATGSPASPESEGTVLEWDALGVTVAVPAQGGCSTPEQVTLRIRNTRTDGAGLMMTREDGTASSIGAGGSTVSCSDEAGHEGHWQGVIAKAGEDRTLFFDCQRLAGDVRCLSTRSEP